MEPAYLFPFPVSPIPNAGSVQREASGQEREPILPLLPSGSSTGAKLPAGGEEASAPASPLPATSLLPASGTHNGAAGRPWIRVGFQRHLGRIPTPPLLVPFPWVFPLPRGVDGRGRSSKPSSAGSDPAATTRGQNSGPPPHHPRIPPGQAEAATTPLVLSAFPKEALGAAGVRMLEELLPP